MLKLTKRFSASTVFYLKYRNTETCTVGGLDFCDHRKFLEFPVRFFHYSSVEPLFQNEIFRKPLHGWKQFQQNLFSNK